MTLEEKKNFDKLSPGQMMRISNASGIGLMVFSFKVCLFVVADSYVVRWIS